MEKIRVALIEEDNNWLNSLSCFLNAEPDMQIVASFNYIDHNINQLLSDRKIDVLLLGLDLENDFHESVKSCYDIFNKYHELNIIVQTSSEDERLIKESFLAGATDYVLKKNWSDIPHKIRYAVKSFNPYKVLLKEYLKLKEQEVLYKLSSAEKEVFYLIIQGFSRSQIGDMTFKSPNTIKKQIKSILTKTGCKTTHELRSCCRLHKTNKTLVSIE
ncbi:LuxR C-terminal-related transcriptional regulator [Bacillus inaquosorum]|uniref:LuxR C-terminal-related transcriptional regulator n=1 Tax=Bacillus inaquosorum TaxID=483913 RepID=UPI0034CDA6BD